ncbi:hypothetical protein PTTG_27431 [Puccinia triticina 1-1 BBBD Race 1]|uniref:Dynactin subunit 3 n=2 Tax=Puccinia triticina TaxID=208348 RepID=A0A180GKB3_PUCT1|nr:uncharacterized protein PtA15_16A341 [Puccinia triticina]XP_053027992.1 uncharacterized protein PtA15_16A345 [Puccinia triticina]OAV93100.1 hypothetical protein PTTG_27431 [Puccinia triticina 1-1 BBBD Race 1]WAQ92433.1 hypothetical protein PtA15_16A341 [Puccinia triticina]WAQ92437.1 hypothetical protein PtA15_16A345 [Puccinia triticina]
MATDQPHPAHAQAEQQDDATLALDLRIRLLECVFAGALPSSESFANRLSSEAASKKSMAIRLERLLGQLSTILDSKPNEAIRRFVQSYDLNEPLLHLPNPLSANKEASTLSISEKASLVFEAEPEIVQLERDLREIELLDTRGFVGAGKLADGDWSAEELATTVAGPLQESTTKIDELEQTATTLLSSYDSYVNALSEIFVSWDSILTTLEEDIHKLQIAKAP